ncbi:MAG TPA: polysaccharide deacetylase family protein [Bryobacteraceae bacterium]|nr:polysaccharide deacetylase family protein [Bryobacteraceae bacterium]
MYRKLKLSLLRAAKTTGALAVLLDSEWRRRKLLIVCYHGISLDDEHRWDPSLFLSPDVFESRMELLHALGAQVLPLGEALERLRAGSLPPRAVALTFDDGFFDFRERAWPILRRYGFPATVYLTTYYSAFNRPVFGITASYLLWKSGQGHVSLETVTGESLSLPCGDAESRNKVRAHLEDFVRKNNGGGQESDELLSRLAAAAGVSGAEAELRRRRILHLLTPAESAALAAEGVDMQLHTHRHRTPLDRSLFVRELEDNRHALQASGASANPSHFCYPSGVHEAEFFPWLRECGIASATTCDTGLASAGENPLLLPRLVDFSALRPLEFEAWVTGAPAFFPRKTRHGLRIG